MSSNLLKSGFVTYQPTEAKVIDVESIIARKLESMEAQEYGQMPENYEAEQDIPEGMDSEQAAALFGELEDLEESSSVFQEKIPAPVIKAPVQEGPSPEELFARAEEEIKYMYEDARKEIESLKQSALEEGMEQGKKEGYEQGYEEAMQQAEVYRQEYTEKQMHLERLYEEKIAALEPLFVEQLTDIYEQVFKVSLSEEKAIVVHLLETALRGIESGKEFVIRVSSEEISYVKNQKKKLVACQPDAKIEIVEDASLKKGDCLIETGGGVFDCSLDVEVYELSKKLRMLAHQPK